MFTYWLINLQCVFKMYAFNRSINVQNQEKSSLAWNLY